MTISPDGAALIATVYPIGILILAVEARAALVAIVQQMSRGVQVFMATFIVLVVALSSGAVVFCVQAVSSGSTLGGFDFWFVSLPGYALGVLVSGALGARSSNC